MGYSNYEQIKTVAKKFKFEVRITSLFPKIDIVQPSACLVESLRRSSVMVLTNEKTKLERVVSPILLEIAQAYTENFSFFSGELLDVNEADDLVDECDFFFTLHPPRPYVDAPIVAMIKSKDEDLEWGVAQCAAQMYAAKLYNETEGKVMPTIFGCVTDGTEWQFVKLENDVFHLDNRVITDLPSILGVWHQILKSLLATFKLKK